MKRGSVVAVVIGLLVVVGGFVALALSLLDEAPEVPEVVGPAPAIQSPREVAREDRIRRGEAPPDAVAGEGAQIVGRVSIAAQDGAPLTRSGMRVSVARCIDLSERRPNGGYDDVRVRDGPLIPPGEAFGDVTAAATTAADGTYALSGLRPGRYVVMADDGEGHSTSRAIDLPVGAAEIRLDLMISSSGETLRVEVRTADGAPFVGRLGVQCHPAFTSAPGVRWVPVGPSGRALIAGVPFRELRLVAQGEDGWNERSDPLTLPRSEPYVWTLGSGLTELTGSVRDLDSGAPIPGARVAVTDPRGLRTTQSSDDGSYRVLAAESGSLRVSLDGFDPATRTIDETRAIDVVLVGNGTVRGRVVSDIDGEPIAGTTVWAGTPREPLTPCAVTDEEGRFELVNAPVGRTVLHVDGAGWVTTSDRGRARTMPVEVPTRGVAEVEIVVTTGGRYEGRVTGPDGHGVAGAFVAVGDRGTQHRQVMRDVATTTDADGYFVLDGVTRGNQPIFVCRADGFATVRGETETVWPGGVQELDIALPPPLYVDVTVTHDGVPVSRATVSARRVEPGLGHHHVATVFTGTDGRVRLGPLAIGKHWIRAGAPEAAWTDATLTVEDDGHALAIDLNDVRVLRGIVRADGLPVADAHVQIFTRTFQTTMRTEPDGTFRATRVPRAPSRVGASKARRSSTWIDLEEKTDEVEITLRDAPPPPAENPEKKQTAQIDVRLPDGTPVAQFRWRVRQSKGQSWRSNMDEGRAGSIRYEVDPDYPERQLVIWDLRDAGGRPLPMVAARVDLPADTSSTFEFTVPAAGDEISGRVVDENGAVVAGGTVRIVSTDADRDDDPLRDYLVVADVGTDGSFSFMGLHDVPSRLVAVPPPEYTMSPWTDVPAGGGDVTLRVAPAKRAVIQIVDATGVPVPGVRVLVDEEVGHDFDRKFEQRPRLVTWTTNDSIYTEGRTGPDGRAVLERLPTNVPLALIVTRTADMVPDWDTETAWEPEDTTVVMRGKVSIVGRVTLTDGSPAVGARVWEQDADGSWSGSGVGSEGDFSLGPFPDGARVTLRASLPGVHSAEPVSVLAGSEVELTVDPAAFFRIRLDGGEAATARISPSPYRRFDRDVRVRGAAVLSGLDPDVTYTVLVIDDDGNSAALEAVRPDGRERALKLAPGHLVQCNVDLDGDDQDGFEVHVGRGDDPLIEGEYYHGRGPRRIQGVPPGRWTLLVMDPFGREVLARKEIQVPLADGEVIEIR